jgi:hypothetical protein
MQPSTSNVRAQVVFSLLRSAGNRAVTGVVQRVTEHFVPDVGELHVHVRDDGVTFSGIGHSHKYLVRGDKRPENNVREVRADLASRGDARSRKINQWIRRRT